MTSLTYDIKGEYMASSDAAIYVETVLHVRKPDSTAFHPGGR
jgi:hypothetical protein